MEAKDTVIRGAKRIEIYQKYCSEHPDPEIIEDSDFGLVTRFIEAQAEISFKMGRDSRKGGIEELMSIS